MGRPVQATAAVRVFVRFYAELNDFLLPERRQRTIEREIPERDSVKDVIEALGVPHTEVDLVLVNGEPVGFAYQVHDGDRVGVYPVFRSLDVSITTRLRPSAPDVPRFVLDAHLGTLARYLRLLGFDSLYSNRYDDEVLARISSEEQRILLTRDRGLLKRSVVTYGYHVWGSDPERQIVEVVQRFKLAGVAAPFRRCLRCNGVVEQVSKAKIDDQLQPKTRRFYQEFGRCTVCGQVYWKGSHYDRMRRLIDGLVPPGAVR